MDTIDSSESNLPSPLPPPSRLLPALPQAFSDDLAVAPAPQFNSQTLLRGLVRHWWQILLIWLVAWQSLLLFLIYLYVEPTFEAFSTLQVEPVSQKLFGQATSESVDSRGVTLYLQTQVGLLTSDRVLHEAITDPRVVNLSTIKESDDPKAVIRKDMVVEIVKDAYLIRVALELPDPHQAAAIVNAVVRSYLTYNSRIPTQQKLDSAGQPYC